MVVLQRIMNLRKLSMYLYRDFLRDKKYNTRPNQYKEKGYAVPVKIGVQSFNGEFHYHQK